MSTGAGSHHINFHSTRGAVTACSHQTGLSNACQRRPTSAALVGHSHGPPPRPCLAPTAPSPASGQSLRMPGAPDCFAGGSPVASEAGADPAAFPPAQSHGAGSARQGPRAPRWQPPAHTAPLHSDHVHAVSICRRMGLRDTMPRLALPATGPPTSPPACVHQRQSCPLRCLGLLGPPAGPSECPPSRVGTHRKDSPPSLGTGQLVAREPCLLLGPHWPGSLRQPRPSLSQGRAEEPVASQSRG